MVESKSQSSSDAGQVVPAPPPPPPVLPAGIAKSPLSWKTKEVESSTTEPPSSPSTKGGTSKVETANGEYVPAALASAFQNPRKDKKPFSYFTGGFAPDLSEKPAPSFVKKAEVSHSGRPRISGPKVLPIVSDEELARVSSPDTSPAPQPKMPAVIHAQYNDPIGLYSSENVQSAYKQALGQDEPSYPGGLVDSPARERHVLHEVQSNPGAHISQPIPLGPPGAHQDDLAVQVAEAERPHLPPERQPSWTQAAEAKHERLKGGIDDYAFDRNVENVELPPWTVKAEKKHEKWQKSLQGEGSSQVDKVYEKTFPAEVPEWAKTAEQKKDHWEQMERKPFDEYRDFKASEPSWAHQSLQREDKWKQHYAGHIETGGGFQMGHASHASHGSEHVEKHHEGHARHSYRASEFPYKPYVAPSLENAEFHDFDPSNVAHHEHQSGGHSHYGITSTTSGGFNARASQQSRVAPGGIYDKPFGDFKPIGGASGEGAGGHSRLEGSQHGAGKHWKTRETYHGPAPEFASRYQGRPGDLKVEQHVTGERKYVMSLDFGGEYVDVAPVVEEQIIYYTGDTSQDFRTPKPGGVAASRTHHRPEPRIPEPRVEKPVPQFQQPPEVVRPPPPPEPPVVRRAPSPPAPPKKPEPTTPAHPAPVRAPPAGPAAQFKHEKSAWEQRSEMAAEMSKIKSTKSAEAWSGKSVPHEKGGGTETYSKTTTVGPPGKELVPAWKPGAGGQTKAATSGAYLDPEGHKISYTREMYTSSDPGKDFSMLTEEERKVIEQPLQPGIISRHITTKYYKKSTYTSSTTTSTTQAPLTDAKMMIGGPKGHLKSIQGTLPTY